MNIQPYTKNAKKHPKKQLEQIANSIRAFGCKQPIVIDKDGVIIAGHGRHEAMTKILGWSEIKEAPKSSKGETFIPYILAEDLTDEEVRAYRLADNKLNESEWDMDLAIEELEGLNIDMQELTGFDLQLLIKPEERDDEVPELPKEPITVLGDIYELPASGGGYHRVMCGDSTMIDLVEKLMSGQKADMVFTDPPYGVKYQSNMRVHSEKFAVLKNDNTELDIVPVIQLVSAGWIFIWTTWKAIDKWLDNTRDLGYPSNMIIWSKGGGGIGDLKKTFSTDYEIALVYNRGCGLQGKRIGSVWSLGKYSASSYLHPTQKPVALAVEAITKTSLIDNIVLDIFLGSGSTLIACEKTQRFCYGMELDPHYCDVIVQRYVDYTDNDIIKLNGQEIKWNGKTKED